MKKKTGRPPGPHAGHPKLALWLRDAELVKQFKALAKARRLTVVSQTEHAIRVYLVGARANPTFTLPPFTAPAIVAARFRPIPKAFSKR
jgi:hypothetical protein